MKFVDDLTKVKPEEIKCIAENKPPIVAIVPTPKGEEDYKAVIVFDDGLSCAYTLDGRKFLGKDQHFIHKPKTVTYLKSIKQILNEFPDATFSDCGWLQHHTWSEIIDTKIYKYFDEPLSKANKIYAYIDQWIEEREDHEKK